MASSLRAVERKSGLGVVATAEVKRRRLRGKQTEPYVARAQHHRATNDLNDAKKEAHNAQVNASRWRQELDAVASEVVADILGAWDDRKSVIVLTRCGFTVVWLTGIIVTRFSCNIREQN